MELRIPPLLLTLLFLLIVWLLALSLPEGRGLVPLQLELAWVSAALGVMVCGAGVIHFRCRGTTMNPCQPERTSQLVTTGVYAYSRNPMYLGFLLLIAGWSLYWSPLLAVLFAPLFMLYMNRFQISVEERFLIGIFGDEYRYYQQQVGRWL